LANHPSAQKRNRQRVKRALRNRSIKSTVHTQVKTVHAALESNDAAAAKEALARAVVALARAASKRVLLKKTASRHVSRLTARVHKLASA
jgi:small subunit ribosomal protein S20